MPTPTSRTPWTMELKMESNSSTKHWLLPKLLLVPRRFGSQRPDGQSAERPKTKEFHPPPTPRPTGRKLDAHWYVIPHPQLTNFGIHAYISCSLAKSILGGLLNKMPTQLLLTPASASLMERHSALRLSTISPARLFHPLLAPLPDHLLQHQSHL